MLKSKVLMTYFTFVLLRPWSNVREQFQRKEGHSIDFHAILNQKPLESAWFIDPTRRLVYVMYVYIAHIHTRIMYIVYMLYLHRSFFYQVVSLLFANSRNDKRCMYRKFEVRPLGHLENKGIYPQYSKH